jgi:hypothetical protein
VEHHELVTSPVQPAWPIAHGELLQTREERSDGDGWQRWGKQAECGPFRPPRAPGEPSVDERSPQLYRGVLKISEEVDRHAHHMWDIG